MQGSLAAAKQQTEILKANDEQASANVAGLTAQAAHNKQRLADIETPASVAQAGRRSAKLAPDSEIDGVNTAVVA